MTRPLAEARIAFRHHHYSRVMSQGVCARILVGYSCFISGPASCALKPKRIFGNPGSSNKTKQNKTQTRRNGFARHSTASHRLSKDIIPGGQKERQKTNVI
eukprot:6192472-Pleurochrysis_carterae.AAC.2